MEKGIVTRTVNKSVYILGDFPPGALLEAASGAKLLVVSRKRELQPEYLEVLRLAEQIDEEPRSISISRALLVGGEPPEPGEAVKPYEWPSSGRGIFSPEGEVDLMRYSVSPHLSVIGSTGSGKTTLVKMVLKQAARQGYRIVVLDSHNEYEDVIKELGGTVSLPIIPLCQLSDQELLAATGLLRVSTSPIRMMRYLRYFTKAACKALEQLGDDDMQRKLQKFADAMLLLDVINPNVKSLDESNSIAAAFVKIVNEQLGDVVFNALKAVVKREEDRMAAAMMYFTWLLDTARVVRKMDSLPKILSISLLETKQLFSVSDIMLATMSFVFRTLIEMREPSVVVIEEAPKLIGDDVSKRILDLFLAQARKFGIVAILVSQKTGDYVQNTRLVIGRIQNTAWARELASLAPQMPGEIARLLPQLHRGEFIYIDGDVTPIKVVL